MSAETRMIKTDYSLDKPGELINFAKELKSVIVNEKMYTEISGKKYVHVEAWQFCGMTMGVMPVVRLTERIVTDKPNEIKYRAEVELIRLATDQVIGSGIALCSNTENKKRNFDEYAVASMAQTRAIGKAYRNAFGFIVKMAGYEATPHEEMEGVGDDKNDTPPSRNVVAENARYMNMKPSDFEEEEAVKEPTKLQLQRIRSAMKGLGYGEDKITEAIMTIDTYEQAENALAKLKEKGAKS